MGLVPGTVLRKASAASGSSNLVAEEDAKGLAQEIALLQQQVTDVITKTPIQELISQIKKVGFPSTCTFVLNILEKYVKAHLTSDTMLKLSLPKKGPLLTLIAYFVLCQPVMVKVTGKKDRIELRPQPFSALEELQVMVSVLKKIEEQKSVEQQFSMFEALFGGCEKTIKTGARAGETFFERVVFLALSLQSCATLTCAALWMQAHPGEALGLSQSLYSSFCEHLPDAGEPLTKVASLSPLLAQHLALSYTTLYPFHIVGTPLPGVDSARLQPPMQLLSIISNWLEKTPQFLYAPRLIDKKTDLPSFHNASKALRSPASPLAGLMQWCILAPCDHTQRDSEKFLRPAKDPKSTEASDTVATTTPIAEDTVKQTAVKDEKESVESAKVEGKEEALDFQTLIVKLHANLLSVILSDSQSFLHGTLTSDHVAVIVAALLGLSKHQPMQLKKRGKAEWKKQVGKVEDGGDECKSEDLDESVERLAQFLQISLSTGLLQLSSENLSSMASTLPINKLLSLVIAHHSARR